MRVMIMIFATVLLVACGKKDVRSFVHEDLTKASTPIFDGFREIREVSSDEARGEADDPQFPSTPHPDLADKLKHARARMDEGTANLRGLHTDLDQGKLLLDEEIQVVTRYSTVIGAAEAAIRAGDADGLQKANADLEQSKAAMTSFAQKLNEIDKAK
jgi:hypothetical protein